MPLRGCGLTSWLFYVNFQFYDLINFIYFTKEWVLFMLVLTIWNLQKIRLINSVSLYQTKVIYLQVTWLKKFTPGREIVEIDYKFCPDTISIDIYSKLLCQAIWTFYLMYIKGKNILSIHIHRSNSVGEVLNKGLGRRLCIGWFNKY